MLLNSYQEIGPRIYNFVQPTPRPEDALHGSRVYAKGKNLLQLKQALPHLGGAVYHSWYDIAPNSDQAQGGGKHPAERVLKKAIVWVSLGSGGLFTLFLFKILVGD